ncbi:MAG: hypothetical protein WBG50_09725, partial [Desulfomonilaceae bacterium]
QSMHTAKDSVIPHSSASPAERLQHKDSVHIATAAFYHITTLDTFDKKLIKLSGKLGNPLIKIDIPDILYQEDLFLSTQEEEASED